MKTRLFLGVFWSFLLVGVQAYAFPMFRGAEDLLNCTVTETRGNFDMVEPVAPGDNLWVDLGFLTQAKNSALVFSRREGAGYKDIIIPYAGPWKEIPIVAFRRFACGNNDRRMELHVTGRDGSEASLWIFQISQGFRGERSDIFLKCSVFDQI